MTRAQLRERRLDVGFLPANPSILIIRFCAEHTGAGVWIGFPTHDAARNAAVKVLDYLSRAVSDDDYNRRIRDMARRVEEEQAVLDQTPVAAPVALETRAEQRKAAEASSALVEEVRKG
jgi:hypothetical protein